MKRILLIGNSPLPEENTAVIYTEKTEFINIQKKLQEDSFHIMEADIQYIPDNMKDLSPEAKEQFSKLIDNLENDEDVDAVRHNVNL